MFPFDLKKGDVVELKRDDGSIEQRVVRSEPWQLGHGAWVVNLVGISGGYSLERVVRVASRAETEAISND